MHVFSISSLAKSEQAFIKFVQSKHFGSEIDALNQSAEVSPSSSAYRLDPFLSEGILKVGGCLRSRRLHPRITHPMLLAKVGHVVKLIIQHFRKQLAHSGRSHALSAIREQLWIVHGASAVRSVIRRCVSCRRRRGMTQTLKMANLPAERISVSTPFTFTGLDLFGPFYVKNGRKQQKRYGVLFTCLSCRAIHVEIANSLDTDSLINAIRRFVARRGQVQVVHCDNGTSLHGAENELRKALKECEDRMLQIYQIEWRFNSPLSSHRGGVWERMVRSVKTVLSNLLCEFGSRIDDESLHTVVCEAEAVVNSRPLTAISDCPDDFQPLSPSQLLTMKEGGAHPPPGIFLEGHVYGRKRWRRVQYLANLFWSRWKREYVHLLQPRSKWNKATRNLQAGDIVIVADDLTPRGNWPLGRIADVIFAKDGLVRSVSVQTSTSSYRRPVTKYVLVLPVEEQ